MRSNIFGLRQKKITLRARAEALLAKGELSAQELAQFEKLKAELATNEAELIEHETQLARENAQIPEAVIPGNGTGQWQAHRPEGKAGIVGPKSFRDLFPNVPLSSNGYSSMSEFFRAFHLAGEGKAFDPRLQAAANVEDTPGLGGFAVPSEYASTIITRAIEQSVVMSRAQIWPLQREVLLIPGLDSYDHSTTLGGFAPSWITEASTMTPQVGKLYQIQLTANKLAVLGQVSNELLADALNGFEAVYSASLQAAVAFFLDVSLLTDTGAGRPKGVLNDIALLVQAKESGQASGTIMYENAIGMLGQLAPACFSNSIWIANPTCIPQLLAMQNRVWNIGHTDLVGGSAVPAVTVGPDGSFTLLTRPIVFSEKVPELSTQSDLTLVDLSQYAVGLRSGIRIESSSHAGFASDTMYYRCIVRVDGQGTWKSALKMKSGSTVSWVVTLGAR